MSLGFSLTGALTASDNVLLVCICTGELYPASAIGGPEDAAPFRETEDGALFKGREKRNQTDADWRALKAVCQIVQWVHLGVWFVYHSLSLSLSVSVSLCASLSVCLCVIRVCCMGPGSPTGWGMGMGPPGRWHSS